ncbi:MAG: biotin/lipoate A/B protein ligase family protein [bacterium]
MYSELLLTGHKDGAWNMAVDELLLMYKMPDIKEQCRAILRLYGWERPTISLGYFQNPEFDCRNLMEDAKANGISLDIVRRMTGGGAVLHDREITYSFIIRESDDLVPLSIDESYRMVCEGVIEALRMLGAKAHFFNSGVGERARGKGGFCFAHHSKYDIVVDGKKLVGSAQRRKNAIILQHGSIVLDVDKNNRDFLQTKGIRCFEKATSLSDVLNSQIDFDSVRRALVNGFSRVLGMEFTESNLTPYEMAQVKAIKDQKYDINSLVKRKAFKYEEGLART